MTTSIAHAQSTVTINNAFNKQLDNSKLEKILMTSDPKAIIRTIQNDVDLYKIDFINKNNHSTQIQKIIRDLPQSPLNLKLILTGIEMASVIGLFLPFEQLQNTNSRDALFIREDAGVWTLIHEYMHF
jgi:hypothetical protein